ncbi:ATP-binding protein [Burkholderia stagnalis]|uniref:ATP-binding protein n=1 Tax=Burkholderia stagnalis TaxID=1503054 RepID=UPI00075F4DC8|nr:ATP-binding protein [Burkholderia stagnalis]AOK52630.1 histidine kinase [Burkholderia stagnalis]KVN74945.1 histidine kinase [Burkholderia stagnalis]KWI28827.1 histidine kinase [Burkholderia stagnalis]KWI64991.1 histidine kinase [Burkholderia stagnalis]KWO28572.1 histidine kinase [Burkholderia stagnalis]
MPDWLNRVWKIAISVRPAVWPLTAGVALLAALSCTPAAETLLSPLDRLYWNLVATCVDYGERDDVVVISIDKKTIAELGGGASYARTSHAQVLDRLGGASSVVLDMTMFGPARGDDALAAAIARQGRVVLPAHVSPEGTRADTVLLPAPQLRGVAAAVGQRSVVLGSDYLVQGIVPYVRTDNSDGELPHVALQAIHVAGASLPAGDVRLHVQDHVSWLGRIEARSLALFLPTRFNLDRYSYVDVLKGRIPESAWHGRIVFIGDAMSDLSGVYDLSMSEGGRLRRVEVDALVTQALLDGHILSREPAAIQVAVSIVVATVMLLICMLVPGWRMYAFAIGWLATFVAAELVLLLHWSYWTPLGPLLAVCVLIFAVSGWRRAGSLRAFLLNEYEMLRGLAGNHAFVGLPHAAGADAAMPTKDEVEIAMQRIRAWQTAYVDMIETLPYPIFVEQHGELLMCNARGRAMLETLDADGDEAVRRVLAIARDEVLTAKATGKIHSVELALNGRTQMMMVTPFGDGDRHSSTASMICIVDIHNVKAAVESDRLTLRHMAHDLRNPLSTVLSLLEERNQADGTIDEDFLADLHKLVDYSLRVAQDFTQLSRAEHLDTRAYVPVSANDLAAEAVDQVWHSANGKRIRVEGPHYDGDDVFVLGNRDMLLRALANLLDNAIKYSAEETAVDVWIDADDRQVSVAVQDQGIGIPADAMPRLFEPFFQVDGMYRDASRGVGLGLPFVKAVIERHGGSVDVTSTPGQGSRFTVRLPKTIAETLDDA